MARPSNKTSRKAGTGDAGPASHVAKIMRALETLARGPCTGAELTLALGAHPRTVARLLDSLVAEGYVSEYGTGRQRLFSLTLRIVSIGQSVISGLDLADVARPFVQRLSTVLNEACHVSVPAESFVVDLVHEAGSHLVAVKQSPGAQVPYHCTAIGKALLAHLPDKQSAVLRKRLRRFTTRTIVDAAALRKELAAIRAQGYAVDELEFSEELRCLAAPVFDLKGVAICAIGVSAPAVRFPAARIPAVAALVVSEAARISKQLGFIEPDAATKSDPERMNGRLRRRARPAGNRPRTAQVSPPF